MPAAFNQTFNVGADESTTVNELAALVAKAMGKEPCIRHLEARETELMVLIENHWAVVTVLIPNDRDTAFFSGVPTDHPPRDH